MPFAPYLALGFAILCAGTDGAVYNLGHRVIELGSVIRPSHLVSITPTIHNGVDLGDLNDQNLRLKTNYISANIERSNLTVIRYQDIIPFTAKGCLPVYYVADNPAIITHTVIRDMPFREPWTILLFANRIDSIEDSVVTLFARRIIVVGTFVGSDMSREVRDKLLNREIMVISNLARHKLLPRSSGYFTGYMLLFELLTRFSVELPLLANLVLIDHGTNSLRCSRKPGRRLEVLSHEFTGNNLPIMPGIKAPQIIGDEEVMFPEHYGTHLDAPYFLMEDGTTTEQIADDRMFIPCVRVQKDNTSAGMLVGIKAFRDWESKTGFSIPSGSYVFVDTGTNRKWPNAKEYMSIDPLTKEARYMGVDPMTARFLTKTRRIYGLGIDTLSTDGSVGAKRMETRLALANADAISIENVASVDRLPNLFTEPQMNPISKCLLVPLRIQGGTGAPVAIFVHTEGRLSDAYEDSPSESIQDTSGATTLRPFSMLLEFGIVLVNVVNAAL